MTWFRRNSSAEPPPPPPEAVEQEKEDAPEALRWRLWQLVQFVNRSAGRLPVEAVVTARQATDTIREVIETSADRALDVYAIVSINGIVDDYLPTTLRRYLALDPSLTSQVGPSGRTPRAALREQLDALVDAADQLLDATRKQDADALFSQGNFLRTKFSRSDLDL